jgi:hypothetical protein
MPRRLLCNFVEFCSTRSKSIEIDDLLTQRFLISTVILAGSADATKSKAIEIGPRGTCDVFGSQQTVTVEVSSTVVGIWEETGTRTHEPTGTFNPIRHDTRSSPENLTDRASIERWKENSHSVCLSHANVIDIWIEWPRSHVAHVVAGELIASAHRIVEVQRAIVSDWVERVVSTAKHVHCNQIRSRWEAHVIHLAVEGIGAVWERKEMVKFLNFLEGIRAINLRSYSQNT